ncbi:VanZ like protein RDD [Enterococcus durans IPLA 655]|uniref:VanZ like protein RDD n=2 Tax=Enterococcus durans TaxID=53345 RepID=A0A377L324_9ENTE|nr:VanZ family protein [Enterococcus durans]QCJ64178.1 VanZ like protein RDD [Lactobacillus sp. Koumiss]AKX86941.1 VanZ like protein RDD [Enterococcus durans]AKZ48296.1 VanZ like protein RDD [Enterococcus durans]EMS75228.1 VanZ like protein RDD [Enterococcus durans IPLA 655]EOT35377.1 VanZ/RDD domain-containing protein [Enterococcus durans ATCC 6056]
MSSYIEPIRFALIVFPFLALAISSVFFIYEYRKYGTFILTRAIVLYSFVFYLLCAYFLVILPLPTKEAVAQMTGPKMELHLFATWEHFRQNTVLVLSDPSTYLPAMRQSVFLEPVFNLLLIVPFGIYLRYYFRFSFIKTVIASFCLSLFFELTQLSGLYFIYPRPYRLFDVNDLLTNTLGGALGFIIEPVFTFMLPTRARMDEISYEKGKTVSLTRRLVAYLIDWGFLSVFTFIITLLLQAAFKIGSITSSGGWIFIEVILYFMLVPYLTNGRTLGKKIVRIKIVADDNSKLRFKSLFVRYAYLYFIFYGLSWISQLLQIVFDHTTGVTQMTSVFIYLGILFAQFIFVLNIILSFIRKKRVLFYEKASHTHTISTIEDKHKQ